MNRDDIIRMAREATDHLPDADSIRLQGIVLLAFDVGAADERKACSRVRAAKPRELQPVGTGALLAEQQYCFEKGHKEGAASVRAAIRARGQG